MINPNNTHEAIFSVSPLTLMADLSSSTDPNNLTPDSDIYDTMTFKNSLMPTCMSVAKKRIANTNNNNNHNNNHNNTTTPLHLQPHPPLLILLLPPLFPLPIYLVYAVHMLVIIKVVSVYLVPLVAVPVVSHTSSPTIVTPT